MNYDQEIEKQGHPENFEPVEDEGTPCCDAPLNEKRLCGVCGENY